MYVEKMLNSSCFCRHYPRILRKGVPINHKPKLWFRPIIEVDILPVGLKGGFAVASYASKFYYCSTLTV